jgi:hypothetical protein
MKKRLGLLGAACAAVASSFAPPPPAFAQAAKRTEVRGNCPDGMELTGLSWNEWFEPFAGAPRVRMLRLVSAYCSSADSASGPIEVQIAGEPPPAGLERTTIRLRCASGTLAAIRQIVDRGRLRSLLGDCRFANGETMAAELEPRSVEIGPVYRNESERVANEPNLPEGLSTGDEENRTSACPGPVLGVGAQQRDTINRIWLSCGPPARIGAAQVAASHRNGQANVQTPEPCARIRSDGGAGRSPASQIEIAEGCPERVNSMAIAAPPPPAPPAPPPPESICETRPEACSVSRRGSRVRPRPNEPAQNPPPPLGGR